MSYGNPRKNPEFSTISFTDSAYWGQQMKYSNILAFHVFEDRWPNFIDYRTDVLKSYCNAIAFVNNYGVLVFRNKNQIQEIK